MVDNLFKHTILYTMQIQGLQQVCGMLKSMHAIDNISQTVVSPNDVSCSEKEDNHTR